MDITHRRIEIPRGVPGIGDYFCPEFVRALDRAACGFAVWKNGYCWGFRTSFNMASQWMVDFAHMPFKSFDLLWRLCRNRDGTMLVHNGKRWVWPKYAVNKIRSPVDGYTFFRPGKGGTRLVLSQQGYDKFMRLLGGEDNAENNHGVYMSARERYMEAKDTADKWCGPWKAGQAVRDTEDLASSDLSLQLGRFHMPIACLQQPFE